MTTLRCCVIDDEPLAARLIAGYIEKTPSLTLVGEFSSAQEAVRIIVEGGVDVVFLDIQMPQLNGLEFAKIIPDSCRIIFTTAFNSYALESFRVNALDYLLKPISYEDFLSSVAKARKSLCASNPANQSELQHLIVKSEYKLVQIDINDILYIEGVKDYVKIILDGESKSIMTLMNIKSLEHALPQNKFMRVHRSFIVNTSKIKVIERNRIVFGKNYIPVSETYKQQFSEYVSTHTLQPIRNDEE